MFATSLLLAALLLAGQETPAPSTLPGARLIEPFAIELPEEGDPPNLLPTDPSGVLRARLARGEVSTVAVLAVRAPSPKATVRARVASGPDGRSVPQLELFLIRGLKRSNRYMEAMLGREALQKRSASYPDILIRDEPRFETQLRDLRGERFLSQPPQDGITVLFDAHPTRYVLVRATIPPALHVGTHRGTIELVASSGEVLTSVALEIEVLPFTLAPPGKVLSVANDFGAPSDPHFEPSLRDQAAHGMTATRLKGTVARGERDKVLPLLEELGFTHLIQADLPRTVEEAAPAAGRLAQYFYGVDEPQPKGRSGPGSWSRMAEQVRLSRQIHGMGGRVTTSILYPLAIELAQPESRVYRELRPYGIEGVVEPLDWASYGLGLQRLGRSRSRTPSGDILLEPQESPSRPSQRLRGRATDERTEPERARGPGDNGEEGSGNEALFEYVSVLQREYAEGALGQDGKPRSKHPWLETYYLPLGYLKSPFFARLLFGFYLFNSHLDGASAWTLFRPRGNAFTDEDGPDPVIAYPLQEGMAATYWWEAVREGVNDLRYCELAESLVRALEQKSPEIGRRTRSRLVSMLSPYRSLVVDGRRIDLLVPLSEFRKTRAELMDLILQLRDGSGGAPPETDSPAEDGRA
ncbi:MAG: hypothetical protein AB1640_10035 [bacterium]